MCWIPLASTKPGEVEGAQQVGSHLSAEPCLEYLNLSTPQVPREEIVPDTDNDFDGFTEVPLD